VPVCEAWQHLLISVEIKQLNEDMDVLILMQPITIISLRRSLLGAVL
jgi:hypothetical protein